MLILVKKSFRPYYKKLELNIKDNKNLLINNKVIGTIKNYILNPNKLLIQIFIPSFLTINNKNITYRYKVKFESIEKYEEFLELFENCPICFNPLINNTLECNICNNKYHYHCIEKWHKIKTSCPMCRAEKPQKYQINQIHIN